MRRVDASWSLAVGLAAGLFACAFLGAGESVAVSAAARAREASRLQDVVLRGELGTRYAAAVANVLTRQDRYTPDSYRASATGTPGALWWDWPGDQVGRMLSVLHVAEGLGWTEAASTRRKILATVLPLQGESGYFGTKQAADAKDVKLISGNAFALRGLLDGFDDTGDARVLAAARKLGRYFESAFDAWKPKDEQRPIHEFYGHCADGLVRLYQRGGDAWALDLARRIVERAGRTRHTHHSLSLLRGAIELHRVTGDPKHLAPAEDYLRWCREQRLVTGALPEEMPASAQDEGCTLADYVVINLMMFEVTGRDEFVDEAELVLVNHFSMNQFHTGGFGHRAYAQDVVGAKGWQGWDGRFGSENPGCCSLWGQWAFGQIAATLVTRNGTAVEINLYPSADVELPEPEIALALRSDFPAMRAASVAVRCEAPRRFALRLRVPAWAGDVRLKLNGAEHAPAKDGARLVIEREWNAGDRVDIAFGGTLRVVPWARAAGGRVAVFDGPLCLGLSSAEGDVELCDQVPVAADGKLVLRADGRPQAVSSDGRSSAALAPVGQDWQWPDAKNPNRLRVLFGVKKP